MFKIGQKVICVYDNPKNTLIVGKEYTILSMPKCLCGGQCLEIDSGSNRNVHCSNGCIRLPGIYNHKNFRPLKYNSLKSSDILTENIHEKSDQPIKEPINN